MSRLIKVSLLVLLVLMTVIYIMAMIHNRTAFDISNAVDSIDYQEVYTIIESDDDQVILMKDDGTKVKLYDEHSISLCKGNANRKCILMIKEYIFKDGGLHKTEPYTVTAILPKEVNDGEI